MAQATEHLFRQAAASLQSGRLDDAERGFRKLLRRDPKNFGALNLLAIVLMQLGRYAEAEPFIKTALAVNAKNDATLSNYGMILKALRRPEEALERFSQALAINGRNAVTWNNRGTIYNDLECYGEAISDFDKAIKLDGNFADASCNKGNSFSRLKRYNDALAAYDQALAIDPNMPDAWLGRGNALSELDRSDDAMAAYDRALALKPDFADAWNGRGNVFAKLKRYGDAFAAYDRALKIDPDLKYAEGSRLMARQMSCDWADLDADVAHLLSAIRAGKPASLTFPLLSMASTPADQLQCARILVADKFAAMPPLWQGEHYAHERIRVAYLSSDYRVHPIAYLISEVLELHDRNKFEIVGISLGPDDGSDVRSRIVKSFDRFHDVRGKSDREAAELLRQLEIDIAVDLNNYSELCRPGILALRPAPVQASYLGYPSTMGADFIDYAIVDKFVLPAVQQQFWTEKFVYMPDCYLVHDTKTKRNMPPLPPTRAQAGLPDNGFVFCCFNNSFKITPAVFQVWMQLLAAVHGSVAWFTAAGETAQTNLRNEAGKAGIDPARLIFAPRVKDMEEHLSRHRAADLFLDTLPYNAHTTAADALWAGLPVVTCVGDTFPARVAGSLLHAIGLPELVTQTLPDYEALALQLARDPAGLADIKARLARNRDSYPLFDTPRFTRHLEAAYVSMRERSQRGEPPAPFAVAPIA